MKILKPGVIPKPALYRCVCQHCGCFFEAEESEMMVSRSSDEHPGGPGHLWTVQCPTCGTLLKPINIESLPSHVQQEGIP